MCGPISGQNVVTHQGWALVALGRPGRPSLNFCVTGPAGPVRRPWGLWPAWPAAAVSQLAGLAGSPAGNGRLLFGQLLAGRPGRGRAEGGQRRPKRPKGPKAAKGGRRRPKAAEGG